MLTASDVLVDLVFWPAVQFSIIFDLDIRLKSSLCRHSYPLLDMGADMMKASVIVAAAVCWRCYRY